MATKEKLNPKLLEAVAANPPKSPLPTAADRAYLRGLKRRGYTEGEIRHIAAQAGLTTTPDLFKVREKRAPKKAESEPESAAK